MDQIVGILIVVLCVVVGLLVGNNLEKIVDNFFAVISKLFKNEDLRCALVIALVFASPFILEKIKENTKIFEEKPKNVYVYAFPDVSKQKNYRLKAKMIYNKWIRIYFNNGGSILFDDCDEMYSNGVFFNCYSSEKDERWYFKYYDEKR